MKVSFNFILIKLNKTLNLTKNVINHDIYVQNTTNQCSLPNAYKISESRATSNESLVQFTHRKNENSAGEIRTRSYSNETLDFWVDFKFRVWTFERHVHCQI
ncbi:hypothetical protein HanHA89_Chr03g0084101 [Helianthus annuus]|nr:hypothetical protein HanHA89_Chr03g0084101 [Helianthus annuus]